MSVNWSDVRYWRPRNDDIFQYGYTVKPQQDGKFHAVIFKNGVKVKDVPCGRRKVAKARAYRWYEKRVKILRNQTDAANVRRELKERGKPKLTETEKKAVVFRQKIKNADKRMNELGRIVKQAHARIKRAEKQYSKWEKKQRRWLKTLEQLEPSGRIQAFVKQFKSIKKCQCNKHGAVGCPNEPEPMEEMCHACLETCTEEDYSDEELRNADA